MAQIKTDNSHLDAKVFLRCQFIPAAPVVLDCYAGKGIVWREVERKTGKTIERMPIDVRDDIGFHLPGDNIKYLETLDLSAYNVIDLDAYGVPYNQLKVIFKRVYSGCVFATFIQSFNGNINFGLLEDIGFSRAMVKKAPSLYTKRAWDYFLEWLALNGIQELHHLSFGRKHYLYFFIPPKDNVFINSTDFYGVS